MSRVLLVRHAQTAGFLAGLRGGGAGSYRDLTDTGVAQAQAVGRWLAAHEVVPDRIHVGPAPRHVQTFEHARLAAKIPWPDPVVLPELDEHAGGEVIERAVLEERLTPALVDLIQGAREAERDTPLRIFQQVMSAWVAGAVDVPGVEPWPCFRARVSQGLDQLCAQEGSGRTVLAFTSGGFIGAAVASVLRVPHEQTAVELGFAVVNTAITGIRFSGARRGVASFNAAPHLGAEAPVTAI